MSFQPAKKDLVPNHGEHWFLFLRYKEYVIIDEHMHDFSVELNKCLTNFLYSKTKLEL